MFIRPYSHHGDYDMLTTWWQGYSWTSPSKAMLPEETGLIIATEGDKEPVLAGFVIKTNTSIWLLEWIIGNPSATKAERADAQQHLITAAAKLAADGGAEHLMTMSENKGWINSCVQAGFTVTDKSVTHMLGRVRNI